MSVLKLSTAWSFEAIRQTAIDELATYGENDPILRLIVAKRFSILPWFIPTVNALARREAPLSSEDYDRLEALGQPQEIFKFMLKIAQVREAHEHPLPSTNCSFNTTPQCYTHQYAHAIPLYCTTALGINGNVQFNRTTHDFTQAIHRIFDCEQDPATSATVSQVPKPSSWDFS